MLLLMLLIVADVYEERKKKKETGGGKRGTYTPPNALRAMSVIVRNLLTLRVVSGSRLASIQSRRAQCKGRDLRKLECFLLTLFIVEGKRR